MDVHKERISIAVRNAAGKIVMGCVIVPLADLTGFYPANGNFYSRAFGNSVTLLAVGYNYGGP
jgi:hypothetical protein